MKKYRQADEPHNPKWISKAQSREPMFVVQDFFENYTPDEVQTKLWSIIVTALSSDNGDFQTGVERSGVLLLYERLQKLVEASYYINQTPYP